jgi:hypothetical protein
LRSAGDTFRNSPPPPKKKTVRLFKQYLRFYDTRQFIATFKKARQGPPRMIQTKLHNSVTQPENKSLPSSQGSRKFLSSFQHFQPKTTCSIHLTLLRLFLVTLRGLNLGLQPLCRWDCRFGPRRRLYVCLSVCHEYFVLSDRGPCEGPNPRPESVVESMCDLLTSTIRHTSPEY